MAKGDPFYMTARYNGRCGQCNKGLDAGERVVFAPNGKRVFCTKPDSQGCGDRVMRNMSARDHAQKGE